MRILLLEDNSADAELIEFELRETLPDFVLKWVQTEEDFFKELHESPPNLILSDYDLPRYNGALALADARRLCPDVPFILVTGAVSEDRAIEILTSGAKDYVLKTRLQQRLVPAVQRALAEAEEHQARKKAEAELREAHRTLEERVKIRTAELETEMAARTKLEEALRESEHRERSRAEDLATILDAVPTPVIIVHDPESTHMTGNRAANELLRIRHGEISLSAPDDVKPRHFKAMKDGRELRLDELPAQRAARGEHLNDLEFSLVFEDGVTKHMLGYGTPLLNEQGHPQGAVHTLVDITKHKQAEEALRESEETVRRRAEELEKLMNLIPAAVWVSHDPQCSIITGNQAANDFYEASEGENVSAGPDRSEQDLTRRFFHNGRELMPEELPMQQAAARNEDVKNSELDVLLPSGKKITILGNATPLQDTEKQVRGCIGIFVDITQRKQAEEEEILNRKIVEGINRIFSEAITCETEEQLGSICLEVIEALTGSTIGFIGEIGSDDLLYDITISNPGWEACAMIDQTGHRRKPGAFKLHGLYGRVLKDGKSLLVNDPASHPDSIGIPKGHPPLTAFLGTPLIRDEKVIGLIAVGNRDGGYTRDEQQTMESLAPVVLQALLKKRAEKALRESEHRERERAEELAVLSGQLEDTNGELRASREFLEIANRHTDLNQLLQEFVGEIQKFTGCEAVWYSHKGQKWQHPVSGLSWVQPSIL